MRLDIISNININLIANCLDDRNIIINKFSPYDQVVQALYDCKLDVKNDVAFIHIDGEALLKDLSYSDSEAIRNWMSPKYFIDALEHSLKENPHNLHIVSSIVFSPYRLLPYTERNGRNSITYLEYHINRNLESLCKEYSNLVILDMYHLLLQYGWNNFCNSIFWYAAKNRYSYLGLEIISDHIVNIINGWRGNIKKCLVLDCDNTLWGGICGEESVQISEEGRGKIYRDFQRIIKGLKDTGVILTLCSKNNEEDVLEVFNNNVGMVLKWDDFVCKKINWESKAKNIKEIAEELNIGLDSMIFIDDSSFERDVIRTMVKEVIVPGFSDNIDLLPCWFLENVVWKYFPKLKVSESDKIKTEAYLRRQQREEKKKTVEIEDYIDSLDIELTLYVNKDSTLERVAELSQKTNQFKVNNRRWTVSELKERIQYSNKCNVFALEYKDKFGNEGIIGGAITKDFFDLGYTRILDLFISCRVLGRGVEDKFFKMISNCTGNPIYGINYEDTGKNKVAADFCKKHIG